MKHVDVGHCWLKLEPRDCNSIVMRRDRTFNARLTHSPSAKELRKVSFHVQMPQHDSEDGKLQCCQNDAETRCLHRTSRHASVLRFRPERRETNLHGCSVGKCMHRSRRGRHVKIACLVFDPLFFFCCISSVYTYRLFFSSLVMWCVP